MSSITAIYDILEPKPYKSYLTKKAKANKPNKISAAVVFFA